MKRTLGTVFIYTRRWIVAVLGAAIGASLSVAFVTMTQPLQPWATAGFVSVAISAVDGFVGKVESWLRKRGVIT